MGVKNKVIEPPEEVIEQLHNDFTNNSVRFYSINRDKVPSIFIQPNLIHPDVLKKSKFVAVGVSACAVEGRKYIYLAAGRIDQKSGEIVTDLDPTVMAYDLRTGTAAPSGVTCFHGDFEGRTEEWDSTYLDAGIGELEKEIQGEGVEISFEKAPKRFTETMHYMAKAYRENIDRKNETSK